MEYFNVTKTNISYELAFSQCKLLQLESDAQIGDIFGEYILCSTGNPFIKKDNHFDNYKYFTNGTYVNLFPLRYIDIIESNDSLSVDGFTVYKDEKVFYSLKGFDKNLNEIVDLDRTKETIRTNYYYIRNTWINCIFDIIIKK